MLKRLVVLVATLPGFAQVQNGSFESPIVPATGCTAFAGSQIAGWTVVGTSGQNVLICGTKYVDGGISFPAQNLTQWLDLTGAGSNSKDEGVSQTFTTTKNQSYVLSFWVGNVSAGGIYGTNSTVNGTITAGTPSTFSCTNSMVSPKKLVWQQCIVHFTALSNSTTIAFKNGDPPDDNINGLDNVVVERSCVSPPNTSMVAWYTFDELFGTTSINLATGNTGTQQHGPLGIAGGKVGGAASFNGTNQYVESPSSIVTSFGPAQSEATCIAGSNSREGDYSGCRGNFSIDTWIQLTSSVGITVITDKRNGSSPGIYGYHFFLNNDKVGLQLADGGVYPGYTNYYSPSLNLTDGNWHHIAVTVDRLITPNGITWYHNGVAIGNSDPTDRTGSLVSTSPLRIGTRTADVPLTGWFHGNLDELEIFNRALTADEVLFMFNADSFGKCKPIPPPTACGGNPSNC